MVCIGLIGKNMVFMKVEYDYYAGHLSIGDLVSTTSSGFEYCSKQHYYTNTDIEASILAFRIKEDSDDDEGSRYNGNYRYEFCIVAEVISVYDFEEDRRNEPLYTSDEADELEELEAEICF